MECPKCKEVGKVTLIDHQSLAMSASDKQAKANDYFLEHVVYATAKCWDCGYVFEVRTDLSFKPTKPYVKPELVGKVLNTTVVDYHEFENFVQACYGGIYDFVAIHEANNYSQYEFNANNVNSDFHEVTYEKIRKGEYPEYSTVQLFDCLCQDGFLLAGSYTIKVSW